MRTSRDSSYGGSDKILHRRNYSLVGAEAVQSQAGTAIRWRPVVAQTVASNGLLLDVEPGHEESEWSHTVHVVGFQPGAEAAFHMLG